MFDLFGWLAHPKGRALCQGGALPTSDQRHSPARLRRDGHSSGRRHREHHQSVGREGDVGKLSGSTNVTCAKGIKRNQKELNIIKVIQTAKHAKVNLNILAYIGLNFGLANRFKKAYPFDCYLYMRSSSLPQTTVVQSWTVRALALQTDPLEECHSATGFFFHNFHQNLETRRVN